MTRKYFVDQKGNRYKKGYMNGVYVDDNLKDTWFVVISRTNNLYVTLRDNEKQLDNKRYIYGLIRDSIYNGEEVLSRPDEKSHHLILE